MNFKNFFTWATGKKETADVETWEKSRLDVEYTDVKTRTFLKLKDWHLAVKERLMVIDDQFYGVDSPVFQFHQRYTFPPTKLPGIGVPVNPKGYYHRTSEEVIQDYLKRICFVYRKTCTIPKYRQAYITYGVFGYANCLNSMLYGFIHLADVKVPKEIIWDAGKGNDAYQLKSLEVSPCESAALEATYSYRGVEITRLFYF